MNYVEVIDCYKRYKMGDTVIVANNGITFSIAQGVHHHRRPFWRWKIHRPQYLGGMDQADEGQVLIDGADIAQFTGQN